MTTSTLKSVVVSVVKVKRIWLWSSHGVSFVSVHLYLRWNGRFYPSLSVFSYSKQLPRLLHRQKNKKQNTNKMFKYNYPAFHYQSRLFILTPKAILQAEK